MLYLTFLSRSTLTYVLALLEVHVCSDGGHCVHAGLPVLRLPGHCCFCGIIWGDWALDVDWCVPVAHVCCCMNTYASHLVRGHPLAVTTAAADLLHQCIVSSLIHSWSQRDSATNPLQHRLIAQACAGAVAELQ